MTSTIAATILEQIGGSKFQVMTGAKDLMDLGNGLQFGLPSRLANKGINKVRIELDASDTYDVSFWKIRGSNFKMVESHQDVYAEDLKKIFTNTTGLDVSL